MGNKKNLLKLFCITMACVFSCSLFAGSAFAEEITGNVEQGSVSQSNGDGLHVVFTNDIHGYAGDETDEATGTLKKAGYARVKGYYDSIVEKYEESNTLLFDAGDYFQGNSFAAVDEGEGVAKLMNGMNYSAIVPGNHEFDYGLNRLNELYDIVQAPVLAVNIKDQDGNLIYEPYKVFEKAGMKVGVFGIASQSSASDAASHPDARDLDFGTNESIIADSQNAVDELKAQGCDVIFALAHLGNESEGYGLLTSNDIADQVFGVDAIMDGHVHKTYSYVRNGVYICSAGSYSRNYGTIDVSKDAQGNKQIEMAFNKADALRDIVPNAQVQQTYDDVCKEHDKILSTVIGHTPYELVGKRTRQEETNFSRLMARGVLKACEDQADVAFVHGGTIRSSIEAGDVTMGDLLDAVPFDNTIVILEMTGQDIIDQINEVFEDNTDVPVVTGMVINAVKPTQENADDEINQLLSVTIDSKPIDPARTYRVATLDYLAYGGSAHSVMARCKQIATIGPMRKSLVNYFGIADFEEINAADPCLYFRTYQTASVNIKKDDVAWSDHNLQNIALVSGNGYRFDLSINAAEAIGQPVNDTYAIYVDGQDTTQTITVSAEQPAGMDLNYYTVAFDPNGADAGTSPDALVYAKGMSLQLPDAGSMTKQGYEFAGWNTQADGNGDHYPSGDSYTVSRKTNLYAQWTVQEGASGAEQSSSTPKTGENDIGISISIAAVVLAGAAITLSRKRNKIDVE